MKLDKNFYFKPSTELAPLLLGKLLCRQIDGIVKKYRIVETEIYFGEEDSACHAHKGRTERTKVMYQKGGVAYIYLCYGIHYLLNVVSGKENHPEAVLIRGVEGAQGPGKLTKLLNIDKSLNGENLIISDKLWIEDDGTKFDYIMLPRVGIGYALKEDREKLWRFVAKDKR